LTKRRNGKNTRYVINAGHRHNFYPARQNRDVILFKSPSGILSLNIAEGSQDVIPQLTKNKNFHLGLDWIASSKDTAVFVKAYISGEGRTIPQKNNVCEFRFMGNGEVNDNLITKCYFH